MRLLAALGIDKPRGSILAGRNINRRIGGKEVRRTDHQLKYLDRHDWPVFHPRVVSDAERAPNHHIRVCHCIATTDSVSDTINLVLALQGIPAPRIKLPITVLGHPDVVLGKLSPAGLN